MLQKIIKFFSILAIIIGCVFLANGLILAWSFPSASPPNSNVAAPINTSGTSQTKSGSLISSTDIRAPIFYDQNNTGYYVDPASTSRLNAVTPNIISLTTGNSPNSGYNHYAIYEQPGTWTHPYPDLMIEYHTGISYVAYYGYGGHRFYTGYSPDASPNTLAFSVGEGDHNVRVYNNLYVSGTAYANAYYYGSDERLKKNISIIPNALDKVLKLEGVFFEWKDKEKEEGVNLGFIAQDVEEIFPEVVSTDEETGLKSLAYGNLVAPIIEAIKELAGKVENLLNKYINQQKQIDVLEKRIEELEKILNK